MSENPNDGDDRERGNNFHSWKIKRLAFRANVALQQNPATGTTKEIHQQNGNIGKHRELLKAPANRQAECKQSISDDRDIRRSITRMNVREKCRQRTVASECENHSRRAENIAGDKSERGDGRAGQQNRAANVAKKFRRRFRERRVGMIRKIGAKRSLSYKLD